MEFQLYKNNGYYGKINLPARIETTDYHEFEYLQNILRRIIPGVKVSEVGCAPPVYSNVCNFVYHGVVYVGSKQEPEVVALINQIKMEVK